MWTGVSLNRLVLVGLFSGLMLVPETLSSGDFLVLGGYFNAPVCGVLDGEDCLTGSVDTSKRHASCSKEGMEGLTHVQMNGSWLSAGQMLSAKHVQLFY